MSDAARVPSSRLLSLGFAIAMLVALLAFVARIAGAQEMRRDTVLRLTLAQAIGLSSRQNASVESARYRVQAAEGRVTQRRADLLPNLS
nr:hypothetical protein [Gemmatimonadaceae bacterium]